MNKVPVSLDVHFAFGDDVTTCLTMSPQEAFNVMMMPSFSELITAMVPNYELPEVPKE